MNTFNFYIDLGEPYSHSVEPRGRYERHGATMLHEEKTFDSQCRRIFEYNAEAWRYGLCKVLGFSRFALLLNMIGPRNAINLTSLIFDLDEASESDDLQHIRNPLEVVTPLMKLHAPGVRRIRLLYGSESDHPYKGSEVFSIYGGRSEEEVLYDVLKRWGEEIPSLECLKLIDFSGRDLAVKAALEELSSEIQTKGLTRKMGNIAL